jgi:hypothetical protein
MRFKLPLQAHTLQALHIAGDGLPHMSLRASAELSIIRRVEHDWLGHLQQAAYIVYWLAVLNLG